MRKKKKKTHELTDFYTKQMGNPNPYLFTITTSIALNLYSIRIRESLYQSIQAHRDID